MVSRSEKMVAAQAAIKVAQENVDRQRALIRGLTSRGLSTELAKEGLTALLQCLEALQDYLRTIEGNPRQTVRITPMDNAGVVEQ
jgi:hypothetical protein